MIKTLLLFISLFTAIAVSSCATCPYNRCDALKETWMLDIKNNPGDWTRCADRWLLTGQPNALEQSFSEGAKCKSISTTAVKVTNFTHIKVYGSFQVQLEGGTSCNKVTVLGPYYQTQQIKIEVRGDTLYLYQNKEYKKPIDRVIVRISIHNLQELSNYGSGLIEGRAIDSDCLALSSIGSGCILLQGKMNLARVTQTGRGTVLVLGACTPSLSINAMGSGDVNIAGKVGVSSITHTGCGEVNILGADTDGLKIYAAGSGLTTVAGLVDLKQVTAIGNSRVFAYWVNGCKTHVLTRDNAKVGLAGSIGLLNVETHESSRFEGTYLHSKGAYVRTYNASHATVHVTKRLFASSMNVSSVYYLGSPSAISKYSSRSSSVLAVYNDKPVPPFIMPGFSHRTCYQQPVDSTWTYQPKYK